ncbi:hypothetical protein DE146DRAFT_767768 [Phaeosphaeria sp. MPI-PUGE-AT-0046c]|nr:hypothetical protein DE146DRAFT_767768 [Phaeosphaeria sp. MPI-PUGE-AT-0046c]
MSIALSYLDTSSLHRYNATNISTHSHTTPPSIEVTSFSSTVLTNTSASASPQNETGPLNSTITASNHRGNASSLAANITITHPPLLLTTALYPNNTQNSTQNGTKNACQAEFDAYENFRLSEWYPTTSYYKTTVYTWYWLLTTFSTRLYECTQTCGTVCYAGPVTTIVSTTTVTNARSQIILDDPPFPRKMPNCTIPFDECLALQTSYSSAMTSFWSEDDYYQAYSPEPVRPYCSACVSTECYFNGGFGMSLYYFPATTAVSRDYCASEPVGGWASRYVPDHNHTYVPITTGPSAVVNGITMYQGNVYLSYWEPQVHDNCGSRILRKNSGRNQVLTIASDAIHSIRSYPNALAPADVIWDLKPWSVNFDDFNPPVPWSAYMGAAKCAQEGWGTARDCSFVNPDDYYPYMIMPPQIRDLDPAWASCRYDKYAAFDPPIALRPGSNMFSSPATPTAGGDIPAITTPATPGQPGGGGMPIITTRPGRPQVPDRGPNRDQVPSLQPAQGPANEGPDPTRAEPAVPLPSITIGTSVIPVDPTTGVVIQPGVTLRPRDPPVHVDGTTFSMGPSGVVIVDGKGTTTFAIPSANPQPPLITVGTSVLPLDTPGEVIIKPGVTLRPGQPALTIDGTTMSIGASGVVMIGSRGTSTMKIPPLSIVTPAITAGPSILPFDAFGGLVIRVGQTLRPGDPAIAISGTTYSIGPSGVVIIDNRGTSTLPFPVSKEYITVGSETYTLMNGKLTVGPKLTLTGPGGMAILAGTTVMMKSGRVEIVIGKETSIVPMKSRGGDKAAGITGVGDVDEDQATKKNSANARCLPFRWGMLAAMLALAHNLGSLV